MFKRSWMRIAILSATFLTAQLTYANVVLFSYGNSCQNLVGRWSGSGKITNWAIECIYKGTGTVSAIDPKGNFNFHLQANKERGGVVCPNNVTHTLSASCVNGAITLKTDHGDLKGTVAGDAGQASGTVKSMGLSANISVQFKKA